MIPANLMMIGYFPFMLFLFASLPRRRAVVLGFVLGQLFLPVIDMKQEMPGAPTAITVGVLKLTKVNVIGVATLFAALVFDSKRLFAFRPRWFDIPMMLWLCCPALSNLQNGVGLYDSICASRDFVYVYGIGYFLGRVYFTDWSSFQDVAIGLLLGGIAYAPMCIFEAVTHQWLHYRFYNFFPNDPSQSERDGGFRPTVFMNHGLMLALFVAGVTLMALWMWWTGALKSIELWPTKKKIPMKWAVVLLVGTTAIMKSMGAMILFILAVGTLFQVRFLRVPLAAYVFILISPLYLVGRSWTGSNTVGWMKTDYSKENLIQLEKRAFAKPMFGVGFSSQDVIDLITRYKDKDRSGSFQFRLRNEDMLVERALKKPYFGWGEYNKFWYYNKRTKEEEAVCDGEWVITIGNYGYVGLFAQWLVVLLPVMRFYWAYPARWWSHPAVAPAAATAMILIMFTIDNLLNAMFNPIWYFMAGALSAAVGSPLPQEQPPPTKAANATSAETPVRPVPSRELQLPKPSTKAPPGVLRRQFNQKRS